MNSNLGKMILVGTISALVGPAMAAPTVFDFANLKYISNTFSGFLPTDGFSCTGGDKCSSNIASSLNGDLTYVKNGITVHALGSFNGGVYGVGAAVVQDHENGYNGQLSGTTAIGAGLGVYHKNNDNSDDNITVGEAIKLHFDQVVTLSSVGLRSEGHKTTDWLTGAKFEYSFDNTNWTSALLPKNVGQFALTHTGQDFYFRYDMKAGDIKDQFYISSMTVAPVPEPETYAMMLAGLGLVGVAVRRRKQKLAT